MSNRDVIKEIFASGLRGRGGGGFLTGIKWEIASNIEAEQKYTCVMLMKEIQEHLWIDLYWKEIHIQ